MLERDPLTRPTHPTGGATEPGVALLRVLDARPDLVSPILSVLQRPVTDDHDLAQVLHLAAAAAVDWFPTAGWAGVTLRFQKTLVTVAGTDPLVLTVDQAQYDNGDGPCLHAMRTGTVTTVGITEVTRRWPVLGATAAEHGVRAFLAAPLTGGNPSPDGVGSLNIYSADTTGFTNDEIDLVAVLSTLLDRALTEHTALSAAHLRATQLEQAMISRAVIEQAKGILMAVHQIDADAAFTLLRDKSQKDNTRLRALAADFVTAHTGHPAAPSLLPTTPDTNPH